MPVLLARPMSSSSTPKPAARSLRVLYAEDLLQLRQLMQAMLVRGGHRLETCQDGREALARLQAGLADFDVLITDHHMPGMNGLDLVRQVRRLPFAGKIIVFSSELSPQVHDAYVALGVDQVLAKPIRPSDLWAVLDRLFPAAGS